jgi:hypothetical protein
MEETFYRKILLFFVELTGSLVSCVRFVSFKCSIISFKSSDICLSWVSTFSVIWNLKREQNMKLFYSSLNHFNPFHINVSFKCLPFHSIAAEVSLSMRMPNQNICITYSSNTQHLLPFKTSVIKLIPHHWTLIL